MRGEILFPVTDSLFFFPSCLFLYSSPLFSKYFVRHTFCGLIEFFHICDRHALSRQIQTRVFPDTTQEGKKNNIQGKLSVLTSNFYFLLLESVCVKVYIMSRCILWQCILASCEIWQNMEFTSQNIIFIAVTVVK
jgi:hypothetical protein